MSAPDPEPKLYGVLVTFRRPAQLSKMLAGVAAQTRRLERLVVVDNAPTADVLDVVHVAAPDAEYVPTSENLGPAGGIALGMERVLEVADDRDWIVTLDDDDPPRDVRVLEMLHAFAEETSSRDPSTGAVGLAGARFDRRKGQMIRVPDAELQGAVSVDCIGGNQFPMYSVKAVRAVGTPESDLFFGHDDLEFGLRLRDNGYSVYGHGRLWRENRVRYGRIGGRLVPKRSLGEVTWRRYYSLRNLVHILRGLGRPTAAVRVTLLVGIGKPAANLLRDPRRAGRHLRLNARACRDAWARRMGRTVEPMT